MNPVPPPSRPLVYVSGPMTGNPYGCVRQAIDVFNELRSLGAVPILPQLSVLHEMIDPKPYDEWIAYDLDLVEHCDLLVRIEGESPGADREVQLARSRHIPIVWLGTHSPQYLADLIAGLTPSTTPAVPT